MSISLRRSGSTLLALAALALPTFAQVERPGATPPKQEPAAPERPAAQERKTPEGEQPAQRPNGGKPSPERAELLRKMAQEEAKHRDRLARLERLRVLAEQKGDTDRVTKLAELLKKENGRFTSSATPIRKGLGEPAFGAANQRLAQGRHRAADQAAKAERAAKKAEDRPNGQQPAAQPQAGERKGQGKEGQRPNPKKGDKAEKPAGERKADKPAGERKPDAPKGQARSNVKADKSKDKARDSKPADAGAARGGSPR